MEATLRVLPPVVASDPLVPGVPGARGGPPCTAWQVHAARDRSLGGPGLGRLRRRLAALRSHTALVEYRTRHVTDFIFHRQQLIERLLEVVRIALLGA